MRTRCSCGGTMSYGCSLPSFLLLYFFQLRSLTTKVIWWSQQPSPSAFLHFYLPSFFTLFYLYSSSPSPLCWQSPEPQLSFKVSNMQVSSGTPVWSFVKWVWSLSLLFRHTLIQTFFLDFRGHDFVSHCHWWASSEALFLNRFFVTGLCTHVCVLPRSGLILWATVPFHLLTLLFVGTVLVSDKCFALCYCRCRLVLWRKGLVLHKKRLTITK